MSNEVLGHVTCPHCKNPHATVHRQAKGKKSLYYRCYGGDLGDCGTVQIVLSGGQAWIRNNIVPLTDAQIEETADDVAAVAAEKQIKAAKEKIKPAINNPPPENKKRSFMSAFLSED
jgi:hypothetical protein